MLNRAGYAFQCPRYVYRYILRGQHRLIRYYRSFSLFSWSLRVYKRSNVDNGEERETRRLTRKRRLHTLGILWGLELELFHILREIYTGLRSWSYADMDLEGISCNMCTITGLWRSAYHKKSCNVYLPQHVLMLSN